jgi:hypothetical protein
MKVALLMAAIVLAGQGIIGCTGISGTAAPPLQEETSQVVPGSTVDRASSAELFHGVGDLRVVGSSTYRIEDQLKKALTREMPAERNPFFLFFGTWDANFIRAQITDLHLPVLPLLVRQLKASDYGFTHRRRPHPVPYELVLEVTYLAFGIQLGQTQETGVPLGMCSVDWKVMLVEGSERDVVFEKALNVQVPRSVSGGPQTLDAVYEKMATKTNEVLATWDASKRTKGDW